MPSLRSFVAACVASGLLAGCGGSREQPQITSFTADSAAVQAGGTARLTARFSGGAGNVDRGVGAVTSDVPVAVVVADDTTYILTVSADGDAVEASAAVTVVYDLVWEFDNAIGWTLSGGASLGGGALLLETYLSAEPFPQIPPTQGCSGATAEATYGDAKATAGRYETVVFEFNGLVTSDVRTALQQIALRYRGQSVEFFWPGDENLRNVRVEWTAPSAVKVYVGGRFERDLPVSATTRPNGVELRSLQCPVYGEPSGGSRFRIDAIAIRAR